MAEAEEVAKYMAKPYSRVVVPHPSGGCFAEVLELPGCFTQGDTPEEAVKNLEGAMSGWLSAALDAGQAIPEPLALRGYSGHVALRMPKSLHREAVRRAELEGMSLNQYLVAAVGAHVAGQDMADRIADKVARRFSLGVRQTTQLEIAFNEAKVTAGPALESVRQLVEADAGDYRIVENLARREHQNA